MFVYEEDKATHKRDFSGDSDYDEFANEMSFVGNIIQLFHFEPVFIAAGT